MTKKDYPILLSVRIIIGPVASIILALAIFTILGLLVYGILSGGIQ